MGSNSVKLMDVFKHSKKITSIGNAGGGKSTLCRALSKKLNIPLYPIDHIQWKPGWIRTSEEEFSHKHTELLQHDKWIIDGFGPWEHVEHRLREADTIIFIDLPLYMHYWWATKRQIKCLFKSRVGGPPGCPMLPVTIRLYTMMWHIHKDLRPKILNLLYEYGSIKNIVHIKTARQLNLLLREL